MSQHERPASTVPSARPALAHRYSAPQPNSSAFSPFAHSNEDWTQISDLSERRRIQNRIAQRNYRKSKTDLDTRANAELLIGKKLKNRLEKLERCKSVSPDPEAQQGPYLRDQSSTTQSSSTKSASTVRYSPERYSQSPEPSYPHSPDQASYLPLPDDGYLTRTQPSFSYTSYNVSDATTGSFPHSPAHSSTYTIPSPALSAVSYDDTSYLTPIMRQQSSVPLPHASFDLGGEQFDQEYHIYNYNYNYDVFDDKQSNLGDSSTYASYPDANYTYVRPSYSRNHTR